MDRKNNKQVLNTPQDYVNTVVTLKKNNEFAAADALVLEGLERFPKEASLYQEYGDIVMRQKDWVEAVKRWALMREKCPERSNGYIGGVKALKQQRDFAAADALVLEGLERFPKEASLYQEYGDIVMRQKDWVEAVKRWALMREKCPEHARGFVGGAVALQESKDFATADALVREGVGKFPNEAGLYFEYGNIAARQNDWRVAVERWMLIREKCPQDQKVIEKVISTLTSQADCLFLAQQWNDALFFYLKIIELKLNCSTSIIRKISECFMNLKFSKTDIHTTLKKISPKESVLVTDIKNMIFDSEILKITDNFKKVLENWLDDSEAKRLWLESFDCLLKSIRFEQPPKGEVKENYRSRRIILAVSGMGWSGSGAINCYLSEFEEIKSIKGEISMLERGLGIVNIIKNINDKKKFIISIIDFIFLHLLGIFPYQSFDNIRTARMYIKNFNSNQLNHAKKSYSFIKRLAYLIYNYENLDKVNILKDITNKIFDFYSDDDNKILLFDNAIHMRNIDIINYIDGMHIFCCVRDPRSRYIALKNEYAGSNQNLDFSDLDSYVTLYRDAIDKFDNDINRMSNKSAYVYKVQFEKFVISESYRKEEVLNKIHTNLTHTKKYHNFRPWESLFNVFNYIQYKNKEEIEFLHNNLSEYCIDIEKEHIMDVLYECALYNARLQSIIDGKEDKLSEGNFGLRIWNKYPDAS